MDAHDGTVAALASALRERHAAGGRFEPLRRQGRRLTMEEAYAVQDAFLATLPGLRRGTGYKIGLTSPAMQAMCGIGHPVYGELRGEGIRASGSRIELAGFGRLGLECEIAVKLGRELPAGRELTRADVLQCADAVCVAFELVDDCHADYGTLDAASLVADNAWNAGAVLGPWQPVPAELAELRGSLQLQEQAIDGGRVGDALSHPFDSVLWLATELQRRGRRLPAGAIVLTGSIIRTRFPEPGQRWTYSVDGLGSIEVSTC
jgi:2-keto-4-pentenoate hydratase